MKKKLTLDKKTISQLSRQQQSNIIGGEQFTTSFGSCTGGLCCSPQPNITELYTTCPSDTNPGQPNCPGGPDYPKK